MLVRTGRLPCTVHTDTAATNAQDLKMPGSLKLVVARTTWIAVAVTLTHSGFSGRARAEEGQQLPRFEDVLQSAVYTIRWEDEGGAPAAARSP